ncbi:MAG TPA: hypothetical protein VHY22_10965 [Chthoniobacteraceae bacterium]|jgi:hypothetical protein|nr:hypothetical protein [Chthoniobacteraceae bacterium]
MKPLTIGQKAQLALLVIWTVAGLLILTARTLRPSTASVLAWLHAREGAGERNQLARGLALRLSLLGVASQEQVMDSPDFATAWHGFDSRDMSEFLTATLPQGLCALLDETARLPEADRAAFFQESIDHFRHRLQTGDPRIESALLKQLTQRGLGMYEAEAGAEEQRSMAPIIERFSTQLEWL